MACIKKRDEWMNERTDNPRAICPSNFIETEGIIRKEWLPIVMSLFQEFSQSDQYSCSGDAGVEP